MSQEYKRHQSFPLRLSPSIRQQASELAHAEGISLNHFISLAVAEKVSRMEQAALDNGAGHENPNKLRLNPRFDKPA
jgi:hypothetical protein